MPLPKFLSSQQIAKHIPTLDLQGRRAAAEDTIYRTPSLAVAQAAKDIDILDCTFITEQLPPLDKTSPHFPNLTLKHPITIHDSDAYECARNLGPGSKVGVLNLASDREPGGGWRQSLCKTQEEALCYSSTLYATLNPGWFPWPNTGPGSAAGIISPNVLVFKDTLDNDLVDLPESQQHIVAVMTVAAPCFPKLTADGSAFAEESVLRDLREKILLSLRMAATRGVTRLVLGAMGCGVYRCPPPVVAREMRLALELEEFKGWFDEVVFAVYAAGPIGKKNLEVFTKEFAGQ